MTHEEFIRILPAYMGATIIWNTTGAKDFVHPRLLKDGSTNFKIVLRSIDQMTDEEYIGFIKSVRPEYQHHSSAFFYLQFRNCGKLVTATQNVELSTKQINYLRSIGIDCDGLIEAGFAVKEIIT